MKDLLGTLLFAAALAFLAFLAGTAVIAFNIFPSQYLITTYENAYQLFTGNTEASVDDAHHLHPARYEESGVTVFDTARAQPGVNLITSYWWANDRWQPALRLIDMQGNLLHQWTVKPEEIWPESPFADHAAGSKNKASNYVHGAWLMPGGDVVFNVEYAGMVRMNACSEIVWALPYRTHHSVFQDDDGNFWASGLNWRYEINDDYIHPRPIFVDETILQISPDGRILREIFILESIYKSGYGGILADTQKTMDITHLNDVEILSDTMADKYPLFEPGDIMVSLRNLSTVLVIDGDTAIIKWHLRYPLVRQHDPDFEPDGHIVIFDNRDDMTEQGMRLGPTRLLRVNPETAEMNDVFPLEANQAFYTQTGGKHQLLENGNRLVTETLGGRVFEVDTAGNVIWNWVIETRGDGLVPEVLEGSRYPAEMADFDTTNCPAE